MVFHLIDKVFNLYEIWCFPLPSDSAFGIISQETAIYCHQDRVHTFLSKRVIGASLTPRLVTYFGYMFVCVIR